MQANPMCNCKDCIPMVDFCNHPTRTEYMFAAGQQRRAHVEQQIRAMKLDMHTDTQNTGNPHSLVCIKKGTAKKKRLEFLHTVITSLNGIAPKNVNTRDNDTQANKKIKT
eukprot:Phypoly_transcript_13018.p1 GENE.Phypoly_transcript_13018~~Phypoly_transcript_13018.p1  ORF type:complete len:110 (+),score=18.10 Phypoly_transcript_13018:661-990(+)